MILKAKKELIKKAIEYSNAVYNYDRKLGLTNLLYTNRENDHLGYIVEFHVRDCLGLKIPIITDFLDEQDLIYQNMKIDVKGTKHKNPHLIVPTEFKREKDITHYLLGRYDEEEQIIEIYGIISKEEFLEKAEYNEKITPFKNNPILHFSQLYSFEKLLRKKKGLDRYFEGY